LHTHLSFTRHGDLWLKQPENDTDSLADTPKSSHSNALPQRSNIRQKANMKNFAQLANKTLDAESKVLEKKQYSLLKKFESFIDEELASIETKPAENTKTYSEAVKNKEDDSLKNEIEAQKSLLGTESLETLPSLMKDTSRKVWCYNWNGKIFLPGSAEMTPFMEQGLLEIPDFVHPETDLAPGSSLTISQLMASPSSRSRPPPPHNPTIQTTLNDVQNSPTSPKQTPAPPGAGAESAPAVYDYNQHNLLKLRKHPAFRKLLALICHNLRSSSKIRILPLHLPNLQQPTALSPELRRFPLLSNRFCLHQNFKKSEPVILF